MPRQQRFRLPGVPQLVRHRGHNGACICHDERDLRMLLTSVHDAALENECAIHAYSVLGAELHLLVSPRHEDGVGRMMQDIGRSYVPSFNERHQRRGTLWDGRYRACIVQPGGHVLSCYRYVERRRGPEPGRGQPRGLEWSSAPAHLGERPNPMIRDHVAFEVLGRTPAERYEAYRVLSGSPLGRGVVRAIEAALEPSLVFGCDQYKDQLESVLKRRLRPGRPGRPRSCGRDEPGAAIAA